MFNQGRHRLLEHSLFPALFPPSHRPADQCRVNRAPATNNCDSGRGDRSPVLLRNHTRKKRRQNKTGSDGENSALTKQTNLAEQEMYLCITLTIRQSHIICHMLQLLLANHKFLRISSYRICWMEPLTGPLDLKVGVLEFSIQLREAPKEIIFC